MTMVPISVTSAYSVCVQPNSRVTGPWKMPTANRFTEAMPVARPIITEEISPRVPDGSGASTTTAMVRATSGTSSGRAPGPNAPCASSTTPTSSRAANASRRRSKRRVGWDIHGTVSVSAADGKARDAARARRASITVRDAG